jgi:hypothetical protein
MMEGYGGDLLMKEELCFEGVGVEGKYLSHYPNKGHKNIDAGDFAFRVTGKDEANRTIDVTFLKPDNEQAVFHCSLDGVWTHNWILVQNYRINVWALDPKV